MTQAVLLVDFGSTYTKVTAVDIESESILATVRTPTTIETDIINSLNTALESITIQTGITHNQFIRILAASSAGGGLRIVASGIVPELTAKAAKMTALNAGGKVLKVFSFELNANDITEIISIKPDILLLTGGTDGGNRKILMENVQSIANSDNAENNYTVVLACNRAVSDQAAKILEASGKKVVITENVMPQIEVLNINPAREVIRSLFLEEIIKSKGLSTVQTLIDDILMPTPAAVMAAVELLSNGYQDESGLGETLTVDVGGATTDVYSVNEGLPVDSSIIFKGFVEPYVKRTVEGDLGLRHNADHILSETGIERMSEISSIDKDRLHDLIDSFKDDPAALPENDESRNLDRALSQQAILIATKRHAGYLENIYTVEGMKSVQIGKDLSHIKYVIGTGGPVINSLEQKEMLENTLFNSDDPMSLRPKNPKFLIDQNYILSAMGLLSTHYPRSALRIMKNNLKEL